MHVLLGEWGHMRRCTPICFCADLSELCRCSRCHVDLRGHLELSQIEAQDVLRSSSICHGSVWRRNVHCVCFLAKRDWEMLETTDWGSTSTRQAFGRTCVSFRWYLRLAQWYLWDISHKNGASREAWDLFSRKLGRVCSSHDSSGRDAIDFSQSFCCVELLPSRDATHSWTTRNGLEELVSTSSDSMVCLRSGWSKNSSTWRH